LSLVLHDPCFSIRGSKVRESGLHDFMYIFNHRSLQLHQPELYLVPCLRTLRELDFLALTRYYSTDFDSIRFELKTRYVVENCTQTLLDHLHVVS